MLTIRALYEMIRANPHALYVSPDISLFFLKYLRKFPVKHIGHSVVLHSHLPPINSPAYGRLIREHFLDEAEGPSHAQIAVTARCPQKCRYCYNRNRCGEPLTHDEIITAVKTLKDMGVVWLGLTGGEPLLNNRLEEIIETVSPQCAVKLFTTGDGFTQSRARALADAGLYSVAVSLDHFQEAEHDRCRGVEGAWRTALDATAVAAETSGLHSSVSSVLSHDMIHNGDVERFLQFLEGLGIDEAWVSETKPSVYECGFNDSLFTAEDHTILCDIQTRWNRRGAMTVNYLGCFESAEHFGCNAGSSMAYIGPFGEVSPCVFTPMSFGNIRDNSLAELLREMKTLFPSGDRCFIHANVAQLYETAGMGGFLTAEQSRDFIRKAQFGNPSKFIGILDKKRKRKGTS